MKFHIQPIGKGICGQNAVAMLTDKLPSEIIKLVGHARSTGSWELINVLRDLGYRTDGRRKRFTTIPRRVGLLHVSFGAGKKSADKHWVAVTKRFVYDGNQTRPMLHWEYDKYLLKVNGRVTGFVFVEGR